MRPPKDIQKRHARRRSRREGWGAPVALARKENSRDREVTSEREEYDVQRGASAACVFRLTSENGMPASQTWR